MLSGNIFNDALANLDILDDHNLPDNQACIEFKSGINAFSQLNYDDVPLFANVINRYLIECYNFSELLSLLQEGQRFCTILYTWRCCSRALPLPKSNEQSNRTEIYEKTVEVLGPQVNKLMKLMHFCRKAIDVFTNEIKNMVLLNDKKRSVLNQSYILILYKLLEMFMHLDELKNMKSSIKNDYSAYKRAAQFIKALHVNAESLQESQNLSMFLANQHKLRSMLKNQLDAIEFYEEVFYDLIKMAFELFENGQFSTPNEKHLLLKVIAFLLNFIDNDRHNPYNPKQCNQNYKSNGNSGFILNSLDLSISSGTSMKYGGQQQNKYNTLHGKSRGNSTTLNSLSLMDTGQMNGKSTQHSTKKKFSSGSSNNSSSASSRLASLASYSLQFCTWLPRLDKLFGYGPRYVPIYIYNFSDRLGGIDVKSLNDTTTQSDHFDYGSCIAYATDMQINVFATYVTTTPNYDATKWALSLSPSPYVESCGPGIIKSRATKSKVNRNKNGEGAQPLLEKDIDFRDDAGNTNHLLDNGVDNSTSIYELDEKNSSENYAIKQHPVLHNLSQNLTNLYSSNSTTGVNPLPPVIAPGSAISSKKPQNLTAQHTWLGLSTFFTNFPHRQFSRNLLIEWGLAKEMYQNYTLQLAAYINEASLCQNQRILTDSQNADIKELALRGIQLLTHWNCVVSETYAYKLMNPVTSNFIDTEKAVNETEDYERALKYNFTVSDKTSLVEMIGMIKALATLLQKASPLFRESIVRNIYAEMQDLVQLHIRESLRKAVKNKKDAIKNILMALREICIDLPKNYVWSEDPMFKGKKDVDTHFEVCVPRKAAPPSLTQICLMRTLLNLLISDISTPAMLYSLNISSGVGALSVLGNNSGGANAKRALKKDLEPSFVNMIENFLKASWFWPTLLNYQATLLEVSDLSYCWYREFYLEMTMGARVQFPIDMSLPWMLIHHILKLASAFGTFSKKEPYLIENLFYMLEIYNDASHLALMHYKKKHLFDEVQAETNLSWDQLLFQLNESIFSYYKQLAATLILDKKFTDDCSSKSRELSNYPLLFRYRTLLLQKHVLLLGRYLDLNRLLTQRLVLSFQVSLKKVCSDFLSSDLTAITMFDVSLEVNRLAYNMCQGENDQLEMPPFARLLDVCTKQLAAHIKPHLLLDSSNMIAYHIMRELEFDFLPNYTFNATTNRFVRCKEIDFTSHDFSRNKLNQDEPFAPSYSWGSKFLNQAYEKVLFPQTTYVGAIHMKLIVKYLGYQGLSYVYERLLHHAECLINNNIANHTASILKLMPKQCKLLRYDYGANGILAYYQAQLKELLKFAHLKTGTYQLFRELGNVIILAIQLEKYLFEEESMDLVQASIFQNVIPTPWCAEGEKLEHKMKLLELKCAAINVANNIEKLGSAKQSYMARESDLLTKERLCCGLSLFQTFLMRFYTVIFPKNLLFWLGGMSHPYNATVTNEPHKEKDLACLVEASFDSPSRFDRIWSALQFTFCVPGGENEFTIEQLYGEGINWAGCTLLYLLGLQSKFDSLDYSYHLLKVCRTMDTTTLSNIAINVYQSSSSNHQQNINNAVYGGTNSISSFPMDKDMTLKFGDSPVSGQQIVNNTAPTTNNTFNLKRMADRIRKFQVLNGQIFATLSRYIDIETVCEQMFKAKLRYLNLGHVHLNSTSPLYKPNNDATIMHLNQSCYIAPPNAHIQ